MRYTFIKQHDATDCAAACLAMVCLHYKKETTITKLRDMMGTDLKGTNLIGLSNCADKLGFASQAVRVDKEGFLSEYTLPAIANVITKEGLSRFVVVFKITKEHVIIGDPAKDLENWKLMSFIRNSFSSFNRRIFLSYSLTRFLSSISSSLRDNAVLGEWTASFALRRPSLKAFIQVYIVPSGIPNSLAALCPPISWASFTACALNSLS
jgi:hypothetical protein